MTNEIAIAIITINISPFDADKLYFYTVFCLSIWKQRKINQFCFKSIQKAFFWVYSCDFNINYDKNEIDLQVVLKQ